MKRFIASQSYCLVACGLLFGALLQTAEAQTPTPPSPPSTGSQAAVSTDARPYFIEFRSRNAATYGHAFVLYGKNGTKGTIAGLHPAGDAPDCPNCSLFNWTVGHLMPVPAETGKSDGDDEPELYLTARYRVRLTAAEYRKVVAYIKKQQAETKTWNALINNCVEFIGGIAQYMGLEKPSPIGIFATRVYIEELARLNGGTPSKLAKLPDGLARNAPATFLGTSSNKRAQSTLD